MKAASLANLRSLDRVRPVGFLSCQSRFYALPVTVKAWQKLTPTERGELIELALRLRNG